MSINYNVYGAPETWQDCFYAGGSTAPWATLLHGEKAKVPKWNETHPDSTWGSSQLRYGVADGKIEAKKPIDNSIAAVGQGSSSAFRKFFVWGWQPDEGNSLKAIGTAYTGTSFNDNTSPVNMFLFESNNPTSSAVYSNGAFSSGVLSLLDRNNVTQGLDDRIWSPSGENTEGSIHQNGNYYIAPLLSYGTRTFCLQIMVYVLTTQYDPEFVPSTLAPQGNWRTLDQWKDSYSDYPITGCYFRIRSISSYNSSTGVIGYYALNYGSSEYRKVSSGILDEIKFQIDDGTQISDLTDYALFGNTSNSNLGIFLFTAHTGMYKWQATSKNICLMNAMAHNYVRTNGAVMVPYIPYDDEVYEYLMRACACFAMPFTSGKSTGDEASNCSFNQDFTDVDLCLPIVDANGVAHGDYTRGSDNLNNDFIDLSDVRDKGYDPDAPITGFKIYIGDNRVRKIYVGNKDVASAYLGDNEL